VLSRGERRGGGAAQPRYPGRGGASGLVRGLRGQPPFDGAQLPRLPWGGAVIAEKDIAFISDWIDDGCPADDREIASFALSGTASPPELAEVPADNRGHSRVRGLRRLAQRVPLRVRRAQAAGEPRLHVPGADREAALGVPRALPAQQVAGGPAQLQQHRAHPPEPLPARLGALPAVASRLPLRARADAPRPLPRRHHAVLGLDDASVSPREAGEGLDHPGVVQGVPHQRIDRLPRGGEPAAAEGHRCDAAEGDRRPGDALHDAERVLRGDRQADRAAVHGGRPPQAVHRRAARRQRALVSATRPSTEARQSTRRSTITIRPPTTSSRSWR
jgi:hypothetical protein